MVFELATQIGARDVDRISIWLAGACFATSMTPHAGRRVETSLNAKVLSDMEMTCSPMCPDAFACIFVDVRKNQV